MNQLEAVAAEFYQTLNYQRSTFKKKPLFKDLLSEIACFDLLQYNVESAQDPRFKQIVQKFCIVYQGTSIDYIVYDHVQHPKNFQHSPQEVTDCFMKALDDMINGPYKSKLLTGVLSTHLGFACSQQGSQGEIFKIGVLRTKKALGIEAIIYCTSLSDGGFIFCGKAFDPQKKPIFLILNRGTQNQITIGPNRIAFDHEGGEFRIKIPDQYQGRRTPDVLANAGQSLFEIYITPINDEIHYGEGVDFPNDFNQIQNLELGITDIIKDLRQIEQRSSTLTLAFQSQELIKKKNSPIEVIQGGDYPHISRMHTTAPLIKKTRAQILKEYQAAKVKNQNSSNNMSQVITNTAQKVSINSNNINNDQKTPNFNRSQTYNGPQRDENGLTPYQQFLKVQENSNPNRQSSIFNFGNNQNQQQHQQVPQLQPFKFNPPLITNSLYAPYNQERSPFTKTNIAKFNTQYNNSNSNNNNNQFQQQVNFQQPVQNKINFGFSQSNSSAFQQPTTFKFQTINQTGGNQQIKFNPSFQTQNFGAQNNNGTWSLSTQYSAQNQPKQGFQPVTATNTFIQPTLTNNSNQFQQTPQNPPSKQSLVFSQLSLIDQETLKGYLKELSETLSTDQIQKITALMLTDPLQFYQYYETAQQQFQESKLNQLHRPASKTIDLSSKSLPSTIAENKMKLVCKDFDDLTLFFLTLPSSLIQFNEAKYQQLIYQINQATPEDQLSSQKVLRELIIRKQYPINESFRTLMENKMNSDLLLVLRNQEFVCHQIVFASNSDFFKRAIKDSLEMNRHYYGRDGNRMMAKLLVPDWMDETAFKLFILYMYTGKIGLESSQISVTELLNLLRIGNFFMFSFLQEQLIATLIIPQMTPQSAVVFLKECTSDSPNHKVTCRGAWEFLKHYSSFYLQKHLPQLLRTNPQLLYELQIPVMRSVIDKSLMYLVDGSQDLETILQFTADTWAERSITRLFAKSQQSMEKCSAFDYQIISKMGDFLKGLEPKMDYKCQLIKNDVGSIQNGNGSKMRDKAGEEKSSGIQGQSKLNATFVQGLEKEDDFFTSKYRNDVDLHSEWRPNANVLKDNLTAKDVFEDKEPQFSTHLDLNLLKQDFEKNKGATAMSRAFNFGRRSWNLKIDLDYEGNISLWLVERGAPLPQIENEISNKYQQPQIGMAIPVQYSSVLVQFELLDAAFGEYKSLFFYSYSHDTHQVVGHRNFISLNQLKDKGEINLRVHMKEFLLHSSLLHYLSMNFAELYKQDLKFIDTTNLASKFTKRLEDYQVLNLPFCTLFQLFSSNDIKVEDENTLLSFMFYYTQVQSLLQNKDNVIYITDMLSHCLRFYYISSKRILSALRDNEFMRKSKVFFAKASEEFSARISQNPVVLNINNGPASTTGANSKNNPRKYYDMSKLQGRRKATSVSSSTNGQVLIEEILDWLQNSKHNKATSENQASQIYKQEVLKWQNLYYEEKNRNIALYQQQQQLKQQQQRTAYSNNNYKDNNIQSNGILSPLRQRSRRSYSLDKHLIQQQQRQEFTSTIPLVKPQVPPPAAAAIGNVPAFLRVKQISPVRPIAANQTPGKNHQQYQLQRNNSFDQSRYMQNQKENDSLRLFNASYLEAEHKIKNNKHADFSQILSNLNQSNQNLRDRFIPYYKRTKQASRTKPGDDCITF